MVLFAKMDPKMGPRSTQDRPKTGPRSSWIAFVHLEFSFRFLIVSGSVLVPFLAPKWSPWGGGKLGVPPPVGSKAVLGSSWFGPFFVLRFGVAFLSLLGASWSRFGAPLASFRVIFGSLGPVLGRLGLCWARFRPLRAAFWSPITLYAHQFINSSTVQPMACQHFATRAGGLRAERLN